MNGFQPGTALEVTGGVVAAGVATAAAVATVSYVDSTIKGKEATRAKAFSDAYYRAQLDQYSDELPTPYKTQSGKLLVSSEMIEYITSQPAADIRRADYIKDIQAIQDDLSRYKESRFKRYKVSGKKGTPGDAVDSCMNFIIAGALEKVKRLSGTKGDLEFVDRLIKFLEQIAQEETAKRRKTVISLAVGSLEKVKQQLQLFNAKLAMDERVSDCCQEIDHIERSGLQLLAGILAENKQVEAAMQTTERQLADGCLQYNLEGVSGGVDLNTTHLAQNLRELACYVNTGSAGRVRPLTYTHPFDAGTRRNFYESALTSNVQADRVTDSEKRFLSEIAVATREAGCSETRKLNENEQQQVIAEIQTLFDLVKSTKDLHCLLVSLHNRLTFSGSVAICNPDANEHLKQAIKLTKQRILELKTKLNNGLLSRIDHYHKNASFAAPHIYDKTGTLQKALEQFEEKIKRLEDGLSQACYARELSAAVDAQRHLNDNISEVLHQYDGRPAASWHGKQAQYRYFIPSVAQAFQIAFNAAESSPARYSDEDGELEIAAEATDNSSVVSAAHKFSVLMRKYGHLKGHQNPDMADITRYIQDVLDFIEDIRDQAPTLADRLHTIFTTHCNSYSYMIDTLIRENAELQARVQQQQNTIKAFNGSTERLGTELEEAKQQIEQARSANQQTSDAVNQVERENEDLVKIALTLLENTEQKLQKIIEKLQHGSLAQAITEIGGIIDGDSNSDRIQRLTDIKDLLTKELSGIKATIGDAEQLISTFKVGRKAITAHVEKVKGAITDAKVQVQATEEALALAEQTIKKLQQEIRSLKEQVEVAQREKQAAELKLQQVLTQQPGNPSHQPETLGHGSSKPLDNTAAQFADHLTYTKGKVSQPLSERDKWEALITELRTAASQKKSNQGKRDAFDFLLEQGPTKANAILLLKTVIAHDKKHSFKGTSSGKKLLTLLKMKNSRYRDLISDLVGWDASSMPHSQSTLRDAVLQLKCSTANPFAVTITLEREATRYKQATSFFEQLSTQANSFKKSNEAIEWNIT